jgi:hypothetical protein
MANDVVNVVNTVGVAVYIPIVDFSFSLSLSLVCFGFFSMMMTDVCVVERKNRKE